MRKTKAIFFAAAITILLVSCGGPTSEWEELLADDYGDEWPYPGYQTAQLGCQNGVEDRPYVLIQLGSTFYGVNGAAMGVGGWPDSRSQMATDPEYGTYELGASMEIIQRGLSLCN